MGAFILRAEIPADTGNGIMFVDRARIHISSGKGGNGAVTFRREPFVPEGGPDGGDGGKGGDVIFEASGDLRTLMDFRYKNKYKAEDGQNGMKRKKYGRSGSDLVIKVPEGTMIFDEASGKLLADLTGPGSRLVAAKGGKGGRGNVHYKSSVRQAPNFAEAGGFPVERDVVLELKLIADAGLVGFPNVGKSTLLSVCTKARPKIADYHFTTIVPNLGVATVGDTDFVMADIAGIIEGASKGAGMGFQFLKHVERTRVLIHVVDVSGSEGRDPVDDFEKINRELAAYSDRLAAKPQVVCASKTDLISEDDPSFIRFMDYVKDRGYKVFPVSAPMDRGTGELLNEVAAMLASAEYVPEETYYERFDFEAEENDPSYRKIEITEEDGVYVLSGRQLLKIFNSTNFNDTGSLRYLYKYIEKSGVIDELKEMGLKEGDTVRIEDFEFEYIDEF